MPRIRTIAVRSLQIPFTRSFRHASADRSETSTVWADVVLESGSAGCGESCPRTYVTGETLEGALAFCRRIEPDVRENIADLDSLRSWTDRHRLVIDRHPAAWCAIELAILDTFAKDAGKTVEAFLGIPELNGDFIYTAVVGDASPEAFRTAVTEYRRFGFSDFKIKLSGNLERDLPKMAAMRDAGGDALAVRVDANNLWSSADQAIHCLSALGCPFVAIEEPLQPREFEAFARVADAMGCRIVLDESVSSTDDLARLPAPMTRWAVNVRVSKMGGLLRSLAFVERVRAMGLAVIVGAQVGETSLLTRVALPVARAAGNALAAQEGAFGTRLLTRDVCDPPLMFRRGGRLRTAEFPMLSGPGFGISFVP